MSRGHMKKTLLENIMAKPWAFSNCFIINSVAGAGAKPQSCESISTTYFLLSLSQSFASLSNSQDSKMFAVIDRHLLGIGSDDPELASGRSCFHLTLWQPPDPDHPFHLPNESGQRSVLKEGLRTEAPPEKILRITGEIQTSLHSGGCERSTSLHCPSTPHSHWTWGTRLIATPC